MNKTNAYAALSAELTLQGDRPWPELAKEVGTSSERCVQVGDEVCHLVLDLEWASTKKDRIKISGRLNGPSSWNLERLEERIFVNGPELDA